jgi:hypothetical protein
MFGIDYGRKQQPKIRQPRRVRRDGGRANRCVRDGGFGAALGLEGLPLGCAGASLGLGKTIKRVQRTQATIEFDPASRRWEKPV